MRTGLSNTPSQRAAIFNCLQEFSFSVLPWGFCREGEDLHCPHHPGTLHTMCSWRGSPHPTPCDRTGGHGKGQPQSCRAREGCARSGDGYLSVQPSFTFILVFLKRNQSIREGFVLFAPRERHSGTVWLSSRSTGQRRRRQPALLCLLLWLSTSTSVLELEESHCP